MSILARIELDSSAPVGTVLDALEPDRSVEDRYFIGWTPAISSPPTWGRDRHFAITVDDAGRKVVEHVKKTDNVLVAGDEQWRDYGVEMQARLLFDSASPHADDEYQIVGQMGLVARQQTVRRYYTFRMDGFKRFALYRRRDEESTLLGAIDFAIDRGAYYHIRLEVHGTRLMCYVDGRLVIDVHDAAYSTGLAGVRTNTFCWFDAVYVTMTDSQRRTVEAYKAARVIDIARASAAMPRAVEYRRFAVPPAQFLFVGRPGDQRDTVRKYHPKSAPTPTLLLLEKAEGTQAKKGAADCIIRAMTLDGQTLWRKDGLGSLPHAGYINVGDFTGRGGLDVVAVVSDRMVVLDGRDGSICAERELPAANRYNQGRNERTSVSRPHAMRFAKAPAAMGIVLREDTAAGGNGIWAYDGKLNPLWETQVSQPKFGHQPWFFDIDDDGCDEMLLGYNLFDHDGKVLWLLEGTRYVDRVHGARHADNTFLGRMHDNDPDRITSLHTGGSDGLYFADGRTGKVFAHHMVGHAQHVEAGRYRPDLPGLQACCGTRWANFGIMTFFDNEGRELSQFQPDYFGETFRTIHWGPDGQDLIYMQRSPRSLGLWDAFGRRVVELPADIPLDRSGIGSSVVADVCGDERDELLVMLNGELRIYTQSA